MSEKDDAKRMQEALRRKQSGEVDAGVSRILKLLEKARREVLAEVADTDWDRHVLPRISAAIDRHLEQFRARAAQGLTADQSVVWQGGAAAVLETAAAMGIALSLPELPTSLLQALQHKSAQRIGGLTQSAKARLDQTLGTALLTGQPREEAIKAIGKTLTLGDTSGKPQGVFGSVSARAEFIYRQEMGAVYSQAQDLRRDQVVAHAPELQKIWVHDGHPGVARAGHVAMHGQRRDQDEPFLNPITREELQFPRDPNADIGETAGCTCDVFLYRPEYGSVEDFIGAATSGMAEAA